MKKNNQTFLMLVILAFGLCTFNACKDTEEALPVETSAVFSQSFTAKVNGVAFEPDFSSGILSTQTSTILITGSMADGEQIQLFVPMSITPGEYEFSNPFSGSIVQGYYGINDDDFEFARPVEDKMQITSHNTTARQISGTFAFQVDIKGEGLFNITDGVFSVKY